MVLEERGDTGRDDKEEEGEEGKTDKEREEAGTSSLPVEDQRMVPSYTNLVTNYSMH